MSHLLKDYKLDPRDLRVDAYSHTPRGSWVQTIPRGVRISHGPSGFWAVSEAHRSQHQNKNAALDDLVWQLVRRDYEIPEGWYPMDNAPKDKPILVIHRHSADPYYLATQPDHLTPYGTHVEGLGFPEDGPRVAVWGGEDIEQDEMTGEFLIYPDWWFAMDSDFEVPLSPIAWLPIPGATEFKKEDPGVREEDTGPVNSELEFGYTSATHIVPDSPPPPALPESRLRCGCGRDLKKERPCLVCRIRDFYREL